MKSFAKYPNLTGIKAFLAICLLTHCGKAPPSFKLVESPLEEAIYDSDDASMNNVHSQNNGSKDFDPSHDDQTPADRDQNLGKLAASWSFQSSTLTPGSLAFNVSESEIQQRFKMDDNVVKMRSDFKQVNRPVVTEVFQQGTTQASQTENFLQTTNPIGLLDILVVIDSSASMKEEQANLSKKLLPLLNYVKDSDWKIAVVTTDPLDGCLRSLITKGDQDLEQHFAAAVQAGTQGSGNERGILQAVNGIKGECNGGSSWLRNNSTLAVLIVSDEDNCSMDGQDCKNPDGSPAAWAKSNYLVDYLNSIRQVGVNARTYGLIWHPTLTQSACSTGYHPATVYADAIAKTSGTWGSICDADYSNTLRAISFDLSMILQTQFSLQFKPIAATLKVYVNNQLQNSGFKVSGNILEFSQPPKAGSKISVNYDFAQAPLKQRFALTQTADPTTLEVFLDGVKTKNYSYDSNTMTLNFDRAPHASQVKAVYRPASQLLSTFLIDANLNPNSISVAVNGIKTAEYSYSLSNGSIFLKQTPPDQASIQISFDKFNKPRLRYPIYAAPDLRDSIKVMDVQTKKALPIIIEGDEIIFKNEQYKALREIVVIYPSFGESDLMVNIGRDILLGSIEVKGLLSGICDARLLTLTHTVLNMGRCKFANSEAIFINFNYSSSYKNTFELGELNFDLNQSHWRILVDGLETKSYTLVQSQLRIENLPLNAKVEVQLYQNLQ